MRATIKCQVPLQGWLDATPGQYTPGAVVRDYRAGSPPITWGGGNGYIDPTVDITPDAVVIITASGKATYCLCDDMVIVEGYRASIAYGSRFARIRFYSGPDARLRAQVRLRFPDMSEWVGDGEVTELRTTRPDTFASYFHIQSPPGGGGWVAGIDPDGEWASMPDRTIIWPVRQLAEAYLAPEIFEWRGHREYVWLQPDVYGQHPHPWVARVGPDGRPLRGPCTCNGLWICAACELAREYIPELEREPGEPPDDDEYFEPSENENEQEVE